MMTILINRAILLHLTILFTLSLSGCFLEQENSSQNQGPSIKDKLDNTELELVDEEMENFNDHYYELSINDIISELEFDNRFFLYNFNPVKLTGNMNYYYPREHISCPAFCKSQEEIEILTESDFEFTSRYQPYSRNGDCMSTKSHLEIDDYIIPVETNIDTSQFFNRLEINIHQEMELYGYLVKNKVYDYCKLTSSPSLVFILSLKSKMDLEELAENLD